MYERYFFYDYNSKSVVDDATISGLQKESGMTCAQVVDFFGLVAVVHNDFYRAKNSLGFMCEKCGAPMGNVDADFTEWVGFKICSDCRE
jgi:hypothetical protein